MESKTKKSEKEKLSFEKTTVVVLNKDVMTKIKGGGSPPVVIGSEVPTCELHKPTI